FRSHGKQITKQTINSILLPIANLMEIDVKELIVINPNLIKLNSTDQLVKQVEQWSIDKDLHKADPSRQMLKSIEEFGEIGAALSRNKLDDLKDGIGDTVVTLIILAQQHGWSLQECLQYAYDEISQRKGRTINGTFIKESDLDGSS